MREATGAWGRRLELPLFLLLGAVFGFLLSRAGATTPDYYAQLFLFEDLQLLWVIAAAAATAAVGLRLGRGRIKRSLLGHPLELSGKPMRRAIVPGSLLFGAGWGLAGACPGTSLAMLGEGRLGQLFVIIGIVVGTWLYGMHESRR